MVDCSMSLQCSTSRKKREISNDPVYEDILNSITKLCQAHPEICGDNKDKSSRSITGIYEDKFQKNIGSIPIETFVGRSTSCSESYTFTIGSVANSYQPDTSGTYTKVCIDSSGNNVYRQTSNGLYLYALEDAGSKFWFVANRVGGDFKLAGINFGGLFKHDVSFL